MTLRTKNSYDFRNYWSGKDTSYLRKDSDLFYERKVLEHVGHLFVPERTMSVIDMGCGAGELVKYYLENLNIVEAVDYSAKMLARASERCGGRKCIFIEADCVEYSAITRSPVWIASESINQYLTLDKVEVIINNFVTSDSARTMALYDTVDPDRRALLEEGRCLYDQFSPKRNIMIKNAIKSFLLAVSGTYAAELVSHGEAGFGIRPHFWFRMANTYDLDLELVSSKYYEYRYHVIMRKK